ncbi:MAG TPA: sulfotransferase [Rhizomicrobium sp.]|nr:sulfotransferase [Rhizomicrobium sp.]
MLDQFFRLLDNVTVAGGYARPRLDCDELQAHALRQAERRSFNDKTFEPPLRLLLGCYENEADLNVIGRYAAKWDALRCLANLLRFEVEEEEHGAILEEPIERPLFITGFPRSGTTLLHSLLAEDEAFQAPRCWQTIFPYAPRGKSRDRRRRDVERQLRLFQKLAPQMSAMHPLSADGPQECTEITAQVFRSLRFEMTHRVPTYQRWLDGEGHLLAYRFHKRFLQHVQRQQGRGRWVLKSPDHVHALDAVEGVYPDCEIVALHRDPLQVAVSAMKLTEVVRRPFTRSLDKAEIGRQVLGRLEEAANAMMARSAPGAPLRLIHFHHADFADNPLAALETLYRRLGAEMTQTTRGRLETRLAATPNIARRYDYEEFGLDAAELCERFQSYMDYFDVRREHPAWRERGRIRAAAAA